MSKPDLGTRLSLPEEIRELNVDALVRSVAVNAKSRHSLLVGAGASVTSGVPSAEACIWQWKRQIFLSNNPALEDQVADVSVPHVRSRIEEWLRLHGFAPDSGDEYGFYAQQCYPIAEDRRQFFKALMEGARPHFGYQVLARLASARVFRSIWTTNFDGLVARSLVSHGLSPIEIGIDSSQRLRRTYSDEDLLCVALHGDFRYDDLRNTSTETRELDAELREGMSRFMTGSSLVVVGYSGRDQSVMDGLARIVSSDEAPERLYWCTTGEANLRPAVINLIKTFTSAGRNAFLVQTSGFDDLMIRLGVHCLGTTGVQEVRSLLRRSSSQATTFTRGFEADRGRTDSVIKSNAFPISCPSDVLRLDIGNLGPGAWRQLQEMTKGQDVVAVPFKGTVLAIGSMQGVQSTFSSRIRGAIRRTPLAEFEEQRADSAITALQKAAFVQCVSKKTGLRTDGRAVVWEPEMSSQERLDGAVWAVHEGALLDLRKYGDQRFLVIKPTIKVFDSVGNPASLPVQQEMKRRLLTKQYNRQFNDALNTWARRIVIETDGVFEFGSDSSVAFRFEVSKIPAHASISGGSRTALRELPPVIERNMPLNGLRLDEPRLRFSSADGTRLVEDSHPMRGIVRNLPFDYALTQSGISTSVRVGIVCPAADSQRVSDYLSTLHVQVPPDSKQEYLLPFPGFAQAYGCSLTLPSPQDHSWGQCVEPVSNLGTLEGAFALRTGIVSAIESVHAASAANPIVIFVPKRWKQWERYLIDGESFDLHDFIKAYCAQRGIATQFLREETLEKSYRCEIYWWLSLSLYTKAMRTPWVLAGSDPDTAYMGLGFSIDSAAARGQHVVLGCSHLYSADGRGLRYRLSKLEAPFMRGKNPFMSTDDARRVGESARQLFYESNMRLPSRVAIFKRTPFSRDERQGLLQGMGNINEVELLEVTVDPAFRFLASRTRNQRLESDLFPVSRGTALVLDQRHALLWSHGSSDAIQEGRRYYLGKSRIPAPLLLTRHLGSSSLASLASEILGLCKMNWNTFDLYSKLPATLESSNAIARVGLLLDRFDTNTYDYRLFM